MIGGKSGRIGGRPHSLETVQWLTITTFIMTEVVYIVHF